MSESRETIKILGDIIKNQLQLEDSQIMLAFEKYDIPATPGIYVALSYVSEKAIANQSFFDPVSNHEMIDTTIHQLVQIDIMSFDSSARTRKTEVIAALASVFSEQMQEKYHFQIGRIPADMANAASLEETKILNRFTLNVALTALARLERWPDYYDTFGQPQVATNI